MKIEETRRKQSENEKRKEYKQCMELEEEIKQLEIQKSELERKRKVTALQETPPSPVPGNFFNLDFVFRTDLLPKESLKLLQLIVEFPKGRGTAEASMIIFQGVFN